MPLPFGARPLGLVAAAAISGVTLSVLGRNLGVQSIARFPAGEPAGDYLVTLAPRYAIGQVDSVWNVTVFDTVDVTTLCSSSSATTARVRTRVGGVGTDCGFFLSVLRIAVG